MVARLTKVGSQPITAIRIDHTIAEYTTSEADKESFAGYMSLLSIQASYTVIISLYAKVVKVQTGRACLRIVAMKNKNKK